MRLTDIALLNLNLIPYLTIVENVMLPLATLSMKKREKHALAALALEKVGLGGKLGRLPNQISGGEQERVAVARAIVNDPPILLADEPTGNLDSKTSEDIMGIIKGLVQQGVTVIMVTHSEKCAAHADRHLLMEDGFLVSENAEGPAVIAVV